MKQTPKHKNNTYNSPIANYFGVAGFHFWDGSSLNTDGTPPMELWQPIYHAQDHMNGEDVIRTLKNGGGEWTHGMQEAVITKFSKKPKVVAHQYYKSNNKNMAVGYVINRTFNIKTKGCETVQLDAGFNIGITIQWTDIPSFFTPNFKNERLKIDSLKSKTKYHVDWYSLNNYIKSDYLKTNSAGRLKLKFPTLKVNNIISAVNDTPVFWYVVHKNGYANNSVANFANVKEKRKKAYETLFENKTLNRTISIYPNPFEKYLIITSPKNDKIEIKNILGEVIVNQNIEVGINRIDLKHLEKGIYFISLFVQNKTFKIIKL